MAPKTYITSDSDTESVISCIDRKPKARRISAVNKYVCGSCNQSFKRITHLDRHEYKEHTGEKKHCCTYDGCNKTYSIITHLKRHMKSTHEKPSEPITKKIKCDIDTCNKMFQTMTSMRRHIREVHENPKIYNCKHCDEVFTQRLKMRRHEIIKHTGIYPFNCTKCSKGFYTEYHLERHVDCNVYECSGCPLKFTKWTELLTHRKENNHGKLSFKCDLCPKIYKSKFDLKQHHLTKHVEDKQKITYSCKEVECNRTYAYEKNLRQHMKVAHSKNEFTCDVEKCKRTFKFKNNLQNHIKRDHGKANKNSSASSQPKKKIPTATRKDAGKRSKSMVAKLSGVTVDKETEKLLLNRDESNIEIELELTVQNNDTNDEVENPDISDEMMNAFLLPLDEY